MPILLQLILILLLFFFTECLVYLTMRASTYIALFTAPVTSRSIATVFNIFEFQSTLTGIGTDSTATTYKNDCSANNAGVTGIPEQYRRF